MALNVANSKNFLKKILHKKIYSAHRERVAVFFVGTTDGVVGGLESTLEKRLVDGLVKAAFHWYESIRMGALY